MAGVRKRAAGSRPKRRPVWSRWWLNRSVLAKGLIVLVVPMLALVTVTVAALILQAQERNERNAALGASGLSRTALAVLADAVDAETGVRGYVVTSGVLFPTTYLAATARLTADQTKMQAAATNPEESRQAVVVTATLKQAFLQLDALRVRVQQGDSVTELVPDLESSKRVMDRLRTEVADLVAAPTQLLAEKSAQVTRLKNIIEVVEIVGLIVGILIGVAGVALFTTGISRRVRTAAENARRLGSGQDLLAMPTSSDELGRLSDSLDQAQQLLATRLADFSMVREVAVRATEATNTFLSRTSHELRTPLNAVLGFAQLLQLSDLDPEDMDSANRILSGGRHLLALINELIDTAQIEAGQLKLSVESVGVRELVEEVAALMAPLARARGITIDCRYDKPDTAALADRQRLRQILVNLVSNAVKYNRQGGTISMEHRIDPGGRVQISVSDTGPGLTPEEIDRVFLPFERLDAEQHGIEGTGIGLPLALALTEAMKGVLNVNSTPGAGSTFSVHLPVATDTTPAHSLEASYPHVESVRSTEGLTDLVVLSIEDNEANRQVLDRAFQLWPTTTLYTAVNGSMGFDLARLHRPDLILLDLHLPDLPGEEVFARLRAEPSLAGTPVIVLSADATPGTVRRLLARGAAAYLTKPLDLRELHAVISSTMAGRDAITPGPVDVLEST